MRFVSAQARKFLFYFAALLFPREYYYWKSTGNLDAALVDLLVVHEESLGGRIPACFRVDFNFDLTTLSLLLSRPRCRLLGFSCLSCTHKQEPSHVCLV